MDIVLLFEYSSIESDDDIEIHSFESMETAPAMEVHKTSSWVQDVVEEMKKFREFFVKRLNSGNNDLRKFWLRKSKKPVLAVLLVNKPGEGLVMYRGTNMEVSMPTGSLCAERNVIGTALANDPGLKREDLMMVAVLAVPLHDNDQDSISSSPLRTPSPPPHANTNFCTLIDDNKVNVPSSETSESVFFSEVEAKLNKYQRPENIRRSMSIGSFASIIECGDSYESEESWVKDGEKTIGQNMTSLDEANKDASEKGNMISVPPIQEINPEKSKQDSSGTTSNPVRKLVPLYSEYFVSLNDAKENEKNLDSNQVKKSSSSSLRRKKKRTVLLHSTEVRIMNYNLLFHIKVLSIHI